MRVLVTWGSKLGGTKGIARMVAEELEYRGVEVAFLPAAQLRGVKGFDAAIIGGALYASRWHKAALKFVERNVEALRRMPVWLFSSGPLDNSADQKSIPPVKDVAVLMERVGALGHATFGGKLPADAKGFPASAMAKDACRRLAQSGPGACLGGGDRRGAAERAKPGEAHELAGACAVAACSPSAPPDGRFAPRSWAASWRSRRCGWR